MSPQSDERRDVLDIYREVQHEYYRNEQEATHQELQMLKRPKPTEDCHSLPMESESVHIPTMPHCNSLGTDKEEILRFPSDDTEERDVSGDLIHYTVECPVFEAPNFEPFPEYVSCTSAMSSATGHNMNLAYMKTGSRHSSQLS